MVIMYNPGLGNEPSKLEKYLPEGQAIYLKKHFSWLKAVVLSTFSSIFSLGAVSLIKNIALGYSLFRTFETFAKTQDLSKTAYSFAFNIAIYFIFTNVALPYLGAIVSLACSAAMVASCAYLLAPAFMTYLEYRAGNPHQELEQNPTTLQKYSHYAVGLAGESLDVCAKKYLSTVYNVSLSIENGTLTEDAKSFAINFASNVSAKLLYVYSAVMANVNVCDLAAEQSQEVGSARAA